jgi:hypothetical protein
MHREPREPTPAQLRWVYPKIIIFVLGASLGLAGIASGIEWLVTAGVIVLAAGIILRLAGSRADRKAESAEDSNDEGLE